MLREGVATDFEHREAVAKLLMFRSSREEELTSLDAYIARAGEKQKQIYYLGGPDLASIKKSPNLELFRKREIEVLFLTDPLDEVVLSNLGQYQEHQLVSVDAADVELPEAEASEEEAEKAAEEKADENAEPPSGFERVLTLFRDALREEVEEVKRSHRLTDSPCCLVNPSGAVSTQMQKVMHLANKDFAMTKRIFEINPAAPLIRRLAELTANADHDNFVRDCGRQLYANALLMEGMAPDPEGTANRMQQFMTELAAKRSPLSPKNHFLSLVPKLLFGNEVKVFRFFEKREFRLILAWGFCVRLLMNSSARGYNLDAFSPNCSVLPGSQGRIFNSPHPGILKMGNTSWDC